MPERSSIFDMVGPVMIGPSSSHTAGVARIGRVAYKLLGGSPQEAEITFYNSFARTYEGHGSDRAIIGGLLGYLPDDVRLRDALDHAREVGMVFQFKPIGNASIHHPNTVKLKLQRGEESLTMIGVSRGGGVIKISEVNGFPSNFSADDHTMIIQADDRKGSISFIASVLAQDDCNIADMMVSRRGKNQIACHFIEMDSGLREITLQYLQSLPWIHDVKYIPKIAESSQPM